MGCGVGFKLWGSTEPLFCGEEGEREGGGGGLEIIWHEGVHLLGINFHCVFLRMVLIS